MANKRHKPEEIVTKLRQVEVLVGQHVRLAPGSRHQKLHFCFSVEMSV
jgi:hypothetical protein